MAYQVRLTLLSGRGKQEANTLYGLRSSKIRDTRLARQLAKLGPTLFCVSMVKEKGTLTYLLIHPCISLSTSNVFSIFHWFRILHHQSDS
jgi:hypothetical protein